MSNTEDVGEANDWRLMGQETFLRERVLRLAKWSSEDESWDHDHCQFCTAKIWSRASGDGEFSSGYVTHDDDEHWICQGCFDDFKDAFGWTVLPR